MSSSKEVEGIILSIQDYKEHDGLVSILTCNEIFSFQARGIHKPNAKNRSLVQPFTYVHLSLVERSLPILTTGHVLQSFYHVQEDLTVQSVLNVLVDCLKHTTISDSMFINFKSCLESFHLGHSNGYTYACMILKDILKEEGISIHVSDCVSCHRKDHIETISLLDGGFLCSTCNHGRIRKYSKDELIQYHSLFVYKDNQREDLANMYDFTLSDFLFLVRWFLEYTSLHFASYSFLQSIVSL